jgi:hypothetical protein
MHSSILFSFYIHDADMTMHRFCTFFCLIVGLLKELAQVTENIAFVIVLSISHSSCSLTSQRKLQEKQSQGMCKSMS